MHLAIIMDGNRRWAKRNMLATALGHNNGAKALARITELCPKYGVDVLTVYALSGENLIKRSENEVNDIFRTMIEAARSYKRQLVGENVRVRILGRISKLPIDIQESVAALVESTKNCTKLVLQICLNYGGRSEITQAVQKAIDNGEKEITEEVITRYIDSGPEPDLIIRPGGEFRLSNFLTWQSAYSELYFTDKLWPDFDEEELKKAIEFYNSRQRRFGK